MPRFRAIRFKVQGPSEPIHRLASLAAAEQQANPGGNGQIRHAHHAYLNTREAVLYRADQCA
jgi:hypothetical protein